MTGESRIRTDRKRRISEHLTGWTKENHKKPQLNGVAAEAWKPDTHVHNISLFYLTATGCHFLSARLSY